MTRNYFKPNKLLYYYFYWISERQNIFWKRLKGEKQPYSTDEIFNQNKFTNVYRILDRVSQFLISEVIYNGKQYSRKDMFWRILLFKHFNNIKTWNYLVANLSDVTASTSLDDISKLLKDYMAYGGKIYSSAYMMTASFMKNPSIKKVYGITDTKYKHEAYMCIFKTVKKNGLDERLLESQSFEEVFNHLTTIITVGRFLAYQYTVDLNYSPLFNFSENDFIACGPGTIRGIDRTFNFKKKVPHEEVVHYLHYNFDYYMTQYELEFKPLYGRNPTKTDLLNCFCETDKYLRQANIQTEGKKIFGSRMKSKFKPNSNKINYQFPAKWNLKL